MELYPYKIYKLSNGIPTELVGAFADLGIATEFVDAEHGGWAVEYCVIKDEKIVYPKGAEK